ncbi:syntaxin-7-like isoform X2 [Montipora capricornis]|uniref:syntaxin-7-like isoform X2 n=1 Tax=Montipora capricornis TaxID=246305 RepID=UPI0035F10D1F
MESRKKKRRKEEKAGISGDSIDAHVEVTAANVEQANVQLDKARHCQKAPRKMCFILVIVATVAVFLGVIIFASVKLTASN